MGGPCDQGQVQLFVAGFSHMSGTSGSTIRWITFMHLSSFFQLAWACSHDDKWIFKEHLGKRSQNVQALFMSLLCSLVFYWSKLVTLPTQMQRVKKWTLQYRRIWSSFFARTSHCRGVTLKICEFRERICNRLKKIYHTCLILSSSFIDFWYFSWRKTRQNWR